MPETNRKGFRGYMGARMEMNRSTPQHLQQMVMRDYCARNNMHYLLAATEYCMPGCTMMLDAIMNELDSLQGIVMFSLFHFPQAHEKRMEMYKKLFEKGCSLHTAAEGISIHNWDDVMRIEDSWLVHDVMLGQQTDDFYYLTEWDQHNKSSAP